MEPKGQTLIADVLLFIHFGLAAFITVGFFIIPIGYRLGWNWIRKKEFEAAPSLSYGRYYY